MRNEETRLLAYDVLLLAGPHKVLAETVIKGKGFEARRIPWETRIVMSSTHHFGARVWLALSKLSITVRTMDD
jgi:hypothetical protein